MLSTRKFPYKLLFELDLTRGSSYQSRIGLIIDEIHTISSLVQAEQHASRDVISQQLDKQIGLLTDVLQGQQGLQGLLELQSTTPTPETPPYNQETTPHRETPTTIIRITTHTLSTRTWCKPSCACDCHVMRTFQSPKLLRQVTGMLFIGYSGCPLWTKSDCSTADCSASSVSQVSVQYLFPSWLLSAAASAALLMSTYRVINASLIIRRIIPPTAEIWQLEQAKDIDGMRRLFSLGLASPNDSFSDGNSLLHVRLTLKSDP